MVMWIPETKFKEFSALGSVNLAIFWAPDFIAVVALLFFFFYLSCIFFHNYGKRKIIFIYIYRNVVESSNITRKKF